MVSIMFARPLTCRGGEEGAGYQWRSVFVSVEKYVWTMRYVCSAVATVWYENLFVDKTDHKIACNIINRIQILYVCQNMPASIIPLFIGLGVLRSSYCKHIINFTYNYGFMFVISHQLVFSFYQNLLFTCTYVVNLSINRSMWDSPSAGTRKVYHRGQAEQLNEDSGACMAALGR